MEGGGEGEAAVEEGEIGVAGEEGLELEGVFLGFDGAGGVDKFAAGGEEEGAGFEDLGLEVGGAAEAGRGPGPAGVGAAAKDAGVGAGDVEEDAVEGAAGEVLRGQRGKFDAVEEAAAAEGVAEGLGAVGVGLVGDKTGAVGPGCEAGGDLGGLAAGRGAGVEDALAGAEVEEVDGVSGGGVLRDEAALGEAGEGVEAGAVGDDEEIGVVGVGFATGRWGEGWEGPEDGARGFGEGFGDGCGAVGAEVAEPACPEGLGQIESDVGGLTGKVGGEGVAFALEAAQDGVDEGGGAFADGFGGLDGLGQGGMVGHTEDEELRCTNEERGPKFALRHALNTPADSPLQARLVPEHGPHQLQREGPPRPLGQRLSRMVSARLPQSQGEYRVPTRRRMSCWGGHSVRQSLRAQGPD